jgi:hypothetical protein
MPRSIEEYFARSYGAARLKFRAACQAAGLDVESHTHPAQDAGGNEFGTDVARLGPENADKLLVLLSGMHGPELMCGSGCHTGLLREQRFAAMPDDTAVLFIHAINPWGAAHLRRTNEDNIDLARNFLNFDAPLPSNDAYRLVHNAFVPGKVAGGSGQAMAFIGKLVGEHGMPKVLEAVMGGQYEKPDGFSFGGTAPAWSNRTLTSVLRKHGGGARRVVGLDYHSGLGPYGYGSAVVMHTGEALARARRFFGGWVEAPRARDAGKNDEFYVVQGHTADGFAGALPDTELTLVTLEFGTFAPERNLKSLIDDHWLSVCGEGDDAVVKREVLETHCPDDPEWRYAVWTRSEQAVRQALNCLIAR